MRQALQRLGSGSGPGLREFDCAPNSALRNGFLYGRTNGGTFQAIVEAFVPLAASDWTDITIARQRMPISMTPAITLVAAGVLTSTIQFRFFGFNLAGEPIQETSPPITLTSTAVDIAAVIFMSKPFTIISRVQYKLSDVHWATIDIGAVGLWDRESVATGWDPYIDMIGRSHIGIELPVKVEPSQSAELYPQPQVPFFQVLNWSDPAAPIDSDNMATLQPTIDEAGALGGFIVGDKYLNTEAVKGWEGYHNKVRIVRVPGTKTIRADSGATTFRLHTAATGALALDTIEYFLEAKSMLGTARTFAIPT